LVLLLREAKVRNQWRASRTFGTNGQNGTFGTNGQNRPNQWHSALVTVAIVFCVVELQADISMFLEIDN